MSRTAWHRKTAKSEETKNAARYASMATSKQVGAAISKRGGVCKSRRVKLENCVGTLGTNAKGTRGDGKRAKTKKSGKSQYREVQAKGEQRHLWRGCAQKKSK